jgi:hypothetical protein
VELPTIQLPDAVQIETPSLPLPTADVPTYQPLVVPPSNLRRPEGTKEVQTTENPPPKIHFPPLPIIPLPSTEVLVKENVDDHDEQMAILGAAVRLGVVIWSGFIITLNYVELPMVKKTGASSDITFVASIFTGALATFGLSTGRTKGEKDKQQPKQ